MPNTKGPTPPPSSQDSGPGPDAQQQGGHPSISFSDLVGALQWGMEQAHEGDATALLKGSFTSPVQFFPEKDIRLPAGINLVLDFNEGKQPVNLTLSFEPSPITLARLEARAKIIADELQIDFQKKIQAELDALKAAEENPS